ncbi:MAG: hypothetical protein JXR40_08655 [Pontiellaceae bacterium]|nr:hypothetical protein [Pontiellaceae bacterium]
MNNRNSMIIAILALLVGIGGITFGIKSKAENNSLQKKYDELKSQLTSGSDVDETDFNIPTRVASNDSDMTAELLQQIDDLKRQLEQSQTLATRGGRRGAAGADMGGMPAMPEGFDATAMQEQMAERREQQRVQQQERIDMLSNWSMVSGMSPEEQANHDALVSALAAMQNMDGTQDPQAMRDAMGNMREMVEMERNAVLNQLEGMSDDERTEAMSEIGEILGGLGGMMGGRGNRGGGAGGFGGAPGGAGGFGGFGGAGGGGF